MDLNFRLIHARDFIRTTPEGELDLNMSKEILLKLAVENAEPNQYDILIDARHATADLSLAEITELVGVMIEHRNVFQSKLAILARPGPEFDHAKFMEVYANNRSFRVGAFKSFEETINWLMTSSELPSEGGTS